MPASDAGWSYEYHVDCDFIHQQHATCASGLVPEGYPSKSTQKLLHLCYKPVTAPLQYPLPIPTPFQYLTPSCANPPQYYSQKDDRIQPQHLTATISNHIHLVTPDTIPLLACTCALNSERAAWHTSDATTTSTPKKHRSHSPPTVYHNQSQSTCIHHLLCHAPPLRTLTGGALCSSFIDFPGIHSKLTLSPD